METVATWSKNVIKTGFILLFILVPLILTPWNYELFEYNKMMVTYGLTAIIMGTWIVKMIAEKEFRIRRTPLDIPLGLFVLSQLVSTLFSMDPHVSWFGYYSRFNGGMLSVLTYIALYYAFVSNFTGQSELDRENGTSKMVNRKNENQFPISKKPFSIIIRLLQVMLTTGFVVSLYGIAEHFGIDKNLWVQDVQSRVFSTLGQPNWLAAYIIALVPIAMGFGFWKIGDRKLKIEMENRNWKGEIKQISFVTIFYFLFAIIYFITLLYTRSRSGLLAFAVADVVFWGSIVAIFAGSDPAKQGQTLRKQISAPFLLIHALFFLIIIVNGTDIKQIDDWVTIQAWQSRIIRLSNITMKQSNNEKPAGQANDTIPASQSATPLIESGVTDSGDIRKYVWQGAINVWKSSPKAFLIGTGTETYAYAFYQYKPVGHNLTSEWDFLYNKAHNEYLNFLATTGLLGLGTYLCFIGSFIYWFIKTQKSILSSRALKGRGDLYNKDCFTLQSRVRNDIVMVALFAGWLSILITNFFGFSVVIMQIFFYLFPAIIFTLSDIHPSYTLIKIDWNEKTRKILSISLIFLSLLLVSVVIIAWFADKQFARGYHYSRSGYLPEAYQALSTAIALNPREPLYHDELGNVLATLASASWKENQATVSQELANQSIKENDSALSVSPNNVNFWKTRTKIFYALSALDPEMIKEAVRALEKAITLSPADPKLYYNLAILTGQTGEPDKALEYMEKSITLKPNYREGYYGLYLLYKEAGNVTKANATIQEYLDRVDPKDEEFLKLIQ